MILFHATDRFRNMNRPTSLNASGQVSSVLLKDFLQRQNVHYPSARDFAHEKAREYVLQHLLLDIDPDDLLIATLYIVAKDRGDRRANIAYSMSLTDAMMRNWQQNGDGHFYSHLGMLEPYSYNGYPTVISDKPVPLDECFAYEAIYRRTTPQRFASDTQVAMDPKDFKQYIWDADIQSHYQRELEKFWHAQDDGYNILIKASVLRAAYLQYEEGSLALGDKQCILRAMGLPESQSWDELTYDAFINGVMDQHKVSVRELLVYRYIATDIIVFKDENSFRLVVYIPGNSSPLHAFEDLSALCDWFALQCKFTQRRTALEGHFKAQDGPDGTFLAGVKTALICMGAYPHRLTINSSFWNPHDEITLGPAIQKWPFSHFKNNLKERLDSDAKRLLRSRADYNEDVAAEALSAAINITGIIAMAVPVLWIPLAAMSGALVGLGVDEVINGTVENQAQGRSRIIFGVLNAVPAGVESFKALRAARAAAQAGEAVVKGAADEVGQRLEGLSDEERAQGDVQQEHDRQEIAEQRQERAQASPAERQANRETEERQRLAQQQHHAATFDDVKAFGLEPDGLRSLSPELRRELAKFEYREPLDSNGAWTVDSYGAVFKVEGKRPWEDGYFARVHAKVYRVERVEAAQQYRIIASRYGTLKGPFIKRIKGFYSDIDLKLRLAGGDSQLLEDVTAVEPETVLPSIVLPRAQPSFFADIPMDGIEVRWMPIAKTGETQESFFAMDVAEGTRVTYDVDLGCWRRGFDNVLWRNSRGVWKSGSDSAFLKVRNRLRFGVNTEIIKFPRLPGYASDLQPIEQKVHQIWLGSSVPGDHLIETMANNAKAHPNLEFILHLDVDGAATSGELQALQSRFAQLGNINVSDLNEELFFTKFKQVAQSGEPFRYFREGPGQNLAAASDVLRYHLIDQQGGLYMDCDDVIRVSEGEFQLQAGPGDILLGGPIRSPKMNFYGPGNSHFASLPGNPVLQELQRELYRRFTAELDELDRLGLNRSQVIEGIDQYMTKVFKVTGPQLLLDTLKRVRPDYAGLLDASIAFRPGIKSLIYFDYLIEAEDFYTPFARRVKITAGTENSWQVRPS